MPQYSIELVGYSRLKDLGGKLAEAIKRQRPTLFRSLGDALVEDVRHRIISRDEGRWAPASKWARAKTAQAYPTLLGAEKYVKMAYSGGFLRVYGQTGQKWTLTQHHEGFTNELKGADEDTDEHGRVVLKIKDPAQLNLYVEYRRKRDGSVVAKGETFAFVPKKPGVTPSRRIWPTKEEVDAIARPIASLWLQKLVKEESFQL